MAPLLSGLAALALTVQSQGASRATYVCTRSPAKPRVGACASSEWSRHGVAACSKFTPRFGCPQRWRIGVRWRAWCSRAVSWRFSASAVAAQVIACLATALACTKHCCLTLRSWGLPPARHLARVAVVLIIGLAGQVPSRRQPLSSNVRRRRWRRAFKSASSPSSRLAHAVSASLLPSFTACAPACSSCCCCASRLMHPPRLARPRIQAGAHLWRICPCSAAGRAAPGSAVLRGFKHHLRRVRRALMPSALRSTPLAVGLARAFAHRHT